MRTETKKTEEKKIHDSMCECRECRNISKEVMDDEDENTDVYGWPLK